MVWIIVVLAIAVLGFALLIWYVVRLTRLVGDLAGEVGTLAEQGGQLMDLLASVQIPDAPDDGRDGRDGLDGLDGLDGALSASHRVTDSGADVR